MKAEYKQDILKNLLLSLWGLFTLALLFCIVFLVNEMIKGGQDPLANLRGTEVGAASSASQAGSPATLDQRQVDLFFAAENARGLVQHKRSIPLGNDSTVENCRAALGALIAGPGEGALAVLPPELEIKSLFLMEGGELVINFSRELLSAYAQVKSANLEALMVYGVVHTLTQSSLRASGDSPVRRVRFLVEDTRPPENFPAHIDLSKPVPPNPKWATPLDGGA